jgi:hypothetical protein
MPTCLGQDMGVQKAAKKMPTAVDGNPDNE